MDDQHRWLDIDGQIEKLRSRNLEINDTSLARYALTEIGYYRVTGYLHPFREIRTTELDNGETTVDALETFRPGTTLEQVLALIDYDRRLRLLVLDAVERIEISVRTRIGHMLGEKSPFAHLDNAHFETNFVRRYKHGAWVAKAQQSHERSHELFVQHFDEFYEGQLPIWALTELLELGQVAFLYGGFQREIATQLAAGYGVPSKTHFRSWLAGINDVRNVSAHHGRLFNRKLTYPPKRPKAGTIPLLEHLREPGSSKDGFGLYNVLAIMAYLIYNIEPDPPWPGQLATLVDQFPTNEYMGIHSMGFPVDWKELDLWANALRRS